MEPLLSPTLLNGITEESCCDDMLKNVFCLFKRDLNCVSYLMETNATTKWCFFDITGMLTKFLPTSVTESQSAGL